MIGRQGWNFVYLLCTKRKWIQAESYDSHKNSYTFQTHSECRKIHKRERHVHDWTITFWYLYRKTSTCTTCYLSIKSCLNIFYFTSYHLINYMAQNHLQGILATHCTHYCSLSRLSLLQTSYPIYQFHFGVLVVVEAAASYQFLLSLCKGILRNHLQ